MAEGLVKRYGDTVALDGRLTGQSRPAARGRDLLRAMVRSRAAASSMASGMPSSARQIRTTAGALTSVSSKPGSTARARWISRLTEA